MSRRVLCVLRSLAVLGGLAGCGQSVTPEDPRDGAQNDSAIATADGAASPAPAPRCESNTDRQALIGQSCATPDALTCGDDVCRGLICRRPLRRIDAGWVEDPRLQWVARMACNGPLPPPELNSDDSSPARDTLRVA